MGLLQLALGFFLIVLGARLFTGADAQVPLIFLILMYFFHTTGELSISPVGLSMITKLSPGKIVGFVMGAWFLSISLAHEVAATLGQLIAKSKEAAAEAAATGGEAVAQTPMEELVSYTDVYALWGVFVVVGAAIVLFALSFVLKRWMHGIN